MHLPHPIADRSARVFAWRIADEPAPELAFAWKPSRREEVRLCRVGDAWEVRPGTDGEAHRFALESQALKFALELARRAWADDGRLSCVKVLVEGTWEVVEVFGVAMPAPTGANA